MPVDIASGRVGVTWDPDDGARITSLRLDGHEVLTAVDVPGTPSFWTHGMFAMAPYAGRVYGGLLHDQDEEIRLTGPGTDGHVMHGVTADRAWTRVDQLTARLDLDDRWPFGGWVEQRLLLTDDAVTVTLTRGQRPPGDAGLAGLPPLVPARPRDRGPAADHDGPRVDVREGRRRPPHRPHRRRTPGAARRQLPRPGDADAARVARGADGPPVLGDRRASPPRTSWCSTSVPKRSASSRRPRRRRPTGSAGPSGSAPSPRCSSPSASASEDARARAERPPQRATLPEAATPSRRPPCPPCRRPCR